jgi:hypothetical protein
MLKRLFLLTIAAVLVAAALLSFRPAHAQSGCTGTGSAEVCPVTGTITQYATDWAPGGVNQIYVQLNATVVNPDSSCVAGQYETLPSSYATENPALLGAFLAGKTVTLQIVATCTGPANRESIIGVIIP